MRGVPWPFEGRLMGRLGGARLTLSDQRHQIRFEALPVFRRMAQQKFDQPMLAGSEMSMHAAARQPME
jgi:hypothetical protein